MDLSVNLSYYTRLFGPGHPGWESLLEAMAEELEDYADRARSASRDFSEFRALRHEHQPLVANLGLSCLAEAEERIRHTLETGAVPAKSDVDTLAELCQGFAQVLRRELQTPSTI